MRGAGAFARFVVLCYVVLDRFYPALASLSVFAGRLEDDAVGGGGDHVGVGAEAVFAGGVVDVDDGVCYINIQSV